MTSIPPPPDTDRARRLAEETARDFPAAWRPSEGEVLVGTFVRLERGTTRFGPSPIVILKTTEGERAVWIFHASLRSEFQRVRPKRGELVAVRYVGKRASESGHDYHLYKVAVDREGTDVGWDDLEGFPVDDWGPDEPGGGAAPPPSAPPPDYGPDEAPF